MKKNIESIRFNLTPSMSFELIMFNNYKKELNYLKNLYNRLNDSEILSKISEIENKLNICKNNFIKEFRENNYEEIIEFLELKDQK